MKKLTVNWISLLVLAICLGTFFNCKKGDYVPPNSDIPKTSFNLTITISAGVSGIPLNGSYTYPKGETVNYSYELLKGYKNLVITLNGVNVAKSGSIVMDKDQSLKVTAEEISLEGVWEGRTNLNDPCEFEVKKNGDSYYLSTITITMRTDGFNMSEVISSHWDIKNNKFTARITSSDDSQTITGVFSPNGLTLNGTWKFTFYTFFGSISGSGSYQAHKN